MTVTDYFLTYVQGCAAYWDECDASEENGTTEGAERSGIAAVVAALRREDKKSASEVTQEISVSMAGTIPTDAPDRWEVSIHIGDDGDWHLRHRKSQTGQWVTFEEHQKVIASLRRPEPATEAVLVEALNHAEVIGNVTAALLDLNATYDGSRVTFMFESTNNAMSYIHKARGIVEDRLDFIRTLKVKAASPERQQSGEMVSGNYVADKEVEPTRIEFANGRIVRAVGGYLVVERK